MSAASSPLDGAWTDADFKTPEERPTFDMPPCATEPGPSIVRSASEADELGFPACLPTSHSEPVDLSAEVRGGFRFGPICRLALSFSGCGFLGVYHLGAVAAFDALAPRALSRVDRFAGASAGCLVATVAALAPHRAQALAHVAETLYDLADTVNELKFGALTPGFSLIDKLSRLTHEILESESIAWDAEKSQRVYVSLTENATKKNLLCNTFIDHDDFVKKDGGVFSHLMASCYIPVYAGIKEPAIVVKGAEYVDGGLSDNLPKFSDVRTITVSPFSGAAHICPLDSASLTEWTMCMSNHTLKVNVQNILRGAQALFPPKRAVLKRYYATGYRDAMRFLAQQGWLQLPEGSAV